jgi:hypothetical protein
MKQYKITIELELVDDTDMPLNWIPVIIGNALEPEDGEKILQLNVEEVVHQ